MYEQSDYNQTQSITLNSILESLLKLKVQRWRGWRTSATSARQLPLKGVEDFDARCKVVRPRGWGRKLGKLVADLTVHAVHCSHPLVHWPLDTSTKLNIESIMIRASIRSGTMCNHGDDLHHQPARPPEGAGSVHVSGHVTQECAHKEGGDCISSACCRLI